MSRLERAVHWLLFVWLTSPIWMRCLAAANRYLHEHEMERRRTEFRSRYGLDNE